jgi:hypothetical protein
MPRLLLATICCALVCMPATSADDKNVIHPFDGKDTRGWKYKGKEGSVWFVGVATVASTGLAVNPPESGSPADLVNLKPGADIYTEEKFGDIHLEIEFMYPKGSNSGIYLMGEYEVQILDSFGKEKVGPGDLGGIYNTAAPKVNAAKKPGEWQKMVIDFEAPKFEGGKKVANAKFVKVTLNDQVIHENVEPKTQTPGGLTGKEVPAGPLMFQGDHGQVAFRNIAITPKK